MASPTADLVKLAQKLIRDGPKRIEPTSRRIRGLFNGKYVFDTTNARYVWEVDLRYPQYYIPYLDFTTRDAKLFAGEVINYTSGAAHLYKLTSGTRSTNRLLVFHSGPLQDLIKVDFSAIDQWFEEDTRIYCHPKDPYKRIDILPSSRSVKLALDGVTLAETTSALFLLETTLRTRYYVPPTSINWEYLTPSDTTTLCPYKGQAEYYHVNVNGKVYKDLVWYYRYPTIESALIAGYLCFYNEGVDVWVDGVKEER
ncbi:hypothetical protein COCMIDRAFT_31600 [Bipolaris oryzae ATCC 44560]|uniref:DUF427 domain-containing protein n=1 Tax=Bipolaris oryzae ATCC 44560 TaxID=930090 RepID=W6ZLT4_COCMI|nr:uncharacterized protein COCMIDRAFT_31600 [Bipolaris oryzae ATCC 44560]EUC51035.1 hypothetical protein COCMIDRAFT_31600 [Bipolaris oryzae ATCC 44560]